MFGRSVFRLHSPKQPTVPLVTLAIVWALKHFQNIILGYPITVYTNNAAVTELFKGKKLTGRLSRWYLTIYDFAPSLK